VLVVVAFEVMPVFVFRAVTITLGIKAPEESATVPPTEALTCAKPVLARVKPNISAMAEEIRPDFFKMPPVNRTARPRPQTAQVTPAFDPR
jgi:hypothetical protein